MLEALVIWGAAGHAMIVADIVRLAERYELVGFLDDIESDRHKTMFCGLPILGGREQLGDLLERGVRHLIFGFGDCRARLELSDFVRTRGFTLASAIHPRATIAGEVSIGAGTVLAAGAVVCAGAQIGENVIVNTCASIDHECTIHDGVHISPGVHLGGRVVVGRGTWVGIGAIVKDNVRIGEQSIIGAGALVLHDIPDKVIAFGVPANIRKAVVEI